MWRNKREEVSTELEDGKKYTNAHLSAVADTLLREDSRSELCRECGERGTINGYVRSWAQFDDDGEALKDDQGTHLHIDFPEIECTQGHRWFQGEGQARGIGGENPILFEEHLHSRRRREILPKSEAAMGKPDPSIVQGIYNRSHPQGRKINSPDQRSRNGASYYR